MPKRAIVLPTRPTLTETIPRTDESALPSSSTTSAYDSVSSSLPPYASSQPAPRYPAAASFATSERSISSARSHSRACGTISRSANSRADERMSSCSALGWKSMRL